VVGGSVWALSLAIVLVAACLHASWNLIVKRDDDKLISAWIIVLTPALILSPLLFWTGFPPRAAWSMLLLSGGIHAVYNSWLVRAYEHGDLSVVYPIARGLAPLLVALAAPLVLGERLTPLAVAAIVLVGGGICALGLTAHRSRSRLSSLAWAAATAATTAGYSLVDKMGVMRANALSYVVVLFALNAVLMGPLVFRERAWGQVAAVWRLRRGRLVLGGLSSLGAYLLVLCAMQLTQVSYIAALRESSGVIGALLGWRVLGEPFGLPRILAAMVVAAGLALLVLAMRGGG